MGLDGGRIDTSSPTSCCCLELPGLQQGQGLLKHVCWCISWSEATAQSTCSLRASTKTVRRAVTLFIARCSAAVARVTISCSQPVVAVFVAAQVSAVPINCLCFNQLGSRVFAGDSAGSIHELSVDITPLSSIAATAFRALLETTTGSPSSPLCSSTGNPAVADSGAFSGRSTDYGGSHDRQGEISLIDKQDSPRTPRNKQLELTADEAVSPVAAVLRHGSPAARIAAGLWPGLCVVM